MGFNIKGNCFQSPEETFTSLRAVPNDVNEGDLLRKLVEVESKSEGQSKCDTAKILTILARILTEIEEHRIEAHSNRFSADRLQWLMATAGSLQLLLCIAENNANGAQTAVTFLKNEAYAGNPHATIILCSMLVAHTGSKNAFSHWLFKNGLGYPGRVFLAPLANIPGPLQSELASESLAALLETYQLRAVPYAVSSAVALASLAQFQYDKDFRRDLQQLLERSSENSCESMMNGIMTAISLGEGDTSHLADYYLRGINSATILNHLKCIDIAARKCDPASLIIIAALTTGAGDNNPFLTPTRLNSGGQVALISNKARAILEAIAQDLVLQPKVINALLCVRKMRVRDSRYVDCRQLLATLGTIAANGAPDGNLTEQLGEELLNGYHRAIEALQISPGSLRARGAVESAAEGLAAFRMKFGAEQIDVSILRSPTGGTHAEVTRSG